MYGWEGAVVFALSLHICMCALLIHLFVCVCVCESLCVDFVGQRGGPASPD